MRFVCDSCGEVRELYPFVVGGETWYVCVSCAEERMLRE